VRDLPIDDGPAVVGWLADEGPLALPATWDAARAEARISTDLASATSAAPACVALDAADTARPSGKRGLMLRGIARFDSERTASLDVDRVTWWDGFRTGTVGARRPRTTKQARGAAA
jgi:hypothetical protein